MILSLYSEYSISELTSVVFIFMLKPSHLVLYFFIFLSASIKSQNIFPYLDLIPTNCDGVPVVCGEGDGEQGHRHQAEDGGKGQRERAAETHPLPLCYILYEIFGCRPGTQPHNRWLLVRGNTYASTT